MRNTMRDYNGHLKMISNIVRFNASLNLVSNIEREEDMFCLSRAAS